MDSRGENSGSEPSGEDSSVVTSIQRSPRLGCSDDDGEFIVVLEQNANGYSSVKRVRRPRNLPDKAQDEIMRIRYLKLKQQMQSMSVVSVEDMNRRRRRGLSDDDKALGDLGNPKRQKSNGDVWFTTLAEVTRQEGDAAVCTGADADDGDRLFSRLLREVGEAGEAGEVDVVGSRCGQW